MKQKVNWQDKLPTLKQGIADGKTAAQIADEIGCSTQSVHNARYHYLDCRKLQKAWSMAEISTLKSLISIGMPISEISHAMGRSFASVKEMKSRLKKELAH